MALRRSLEHAPVQAESQYGPLVQKVRAESVKAEQVRSLPPDGGRQNRRALDLG